MTNAEQAAAARDVPLDELHRRFAVRNTGSLALMGGGSPALQPLPQAAYMATMESEGSACVQAPLSVRHVSPTRRKEAALVSQGVASVPPCLCNLASNVALPAAALPSPTQPSPTNPPRHNPLPRHQVNDLLRLALVNGGLLPSNLPPSPSAAVAVAGPHVVHPGSSHLLPSSDDGPHCTDAVSTSLRAAAGH